MTEKTTVKIGNRQRKAVYARVHSSNGGRIISTWDTQRARDYSMQLALKRHCPFLNGTFGPVASVWGVK